MIERKKMNKEYAVIDRTESVIESVFKDLVQLAILAFCVYISRESTWWTFIMGLLFMLNLFTWCAHGLKVRRCYFKTKKELFAWANSLDWNE